MVGVRRWERVKYSSQDGNGHYTGFLFYLAPPSLITSCWLPDHI